MRHNVYPINTITYLPYKSKSLPYVSIYNHNIPIGRIFHCQYVTKSPNILHIIPIFRIKMIYNKIHLYQLLTILWYDMLQLVNTCKIFIYTFPYFVKKLEKIYPSISYLFQILGYFTWPMSVDKNFFKNFFS